MTHEYKIPAGSGEGYPLLSGFAGGLGVGVRGARQGRLWDLGPKLLSGKLFRRMRGDQGHPWKLSRTPGASLAAS